MHAGGRQAALERKLQNTNSQPKPTRPQYTTPTSSSPPRLATQCTFLYHTHLPTTTHPHASTPTCPYTPKHTPTCHITLTPTHLPKCTLRVRQRHGPPPLRAERRVGSVDGLLEPGAQLAPQEGGPIALGAPLLGVHRRLALQCGGGLRGQRVGWGGGGGGAGGRGRGRDAVCLHLCAAVHRLLCHAVKKVALDPRPRL